MWSHLEEDKKLIGRFRRGICSLVYNIFICIKPKGQALMVLGSSSYVIFLVLAMTNDKNDINIWRQGLSYFTRNFRMSFYVETTSRKMTAQWVMSLCLKQFPSIIFFFSCNILGYCSGLWYLVYTKKKSRYFGDRRKILRLVPSIVWVKITTVPVFDLQCSQRIKDDLHTRDMSCF